MRTVSLRYFNVFGPRQDPFSQYAAVIPLFITRILRGEKPVIFGDGEQSRDFIYVENVVEANIRAAESEAAAGEALNVACGEPLTVNDLLGAVNRILGADVSAVHAGAKPGDIRHSLADISKARELIPFEPAVAFEDGLRATIDWYRERS
jgi:UDP-glucose 4-epimerase